MKNAIGRLAVCLLIIAHAQSFNVYRKYQKNHATNKYKSSIDIQKFFPQFSPGLKGYNSKERQHPSNWIFPSFSFQPRETFNSIDNDGNGQKFKNSPRQNEWRGINPTNDASQNQQRKTIDISKSLKEEPVIVITDRPFLDLQDEQIHQIPDLKPNNNSIQIFDETANNSEHIYTYLVSGSMSVKTN